MKDEIKEIIDYFKDDIEFLEKELINTNFLGRYITIRDKECGYLKKLLDYITNLQEELELSHQDNLELLDYKSRNEKAIERLEKEIKANPDCSRKYAKLILINYEKLLNILQGVDKE